MPGTIKQQAHAVKRGVPGASESGETLEMKDWDNQQTEATDV